MSKFSRVAILGLLSTVAASAAPADLSGLGTAATDALGGVTPQLIVVGAVVIGIAGVVMAFKYIKRLIGA